MIDRQGTVKLQTLAWPLLPPLGYGDARGAPWATASRTNRGFLVDERADVFSLAAVVRQALTGHNICR